MHPTLVVRRVCETVSPSTAALEERGRRGQALTHLSCVLWPPYRKQELANSSDVPLPDRSLSPPLTAPPTMKVRGLELVSGEGQGRGYLSGLCFVLVPGPAACPDGGLGGPAASGSIAHLSSAVQEDSVTEAQGG